MTRNVNLAKILNLNMMIGTVNLQRKIDQCVLTRTVKKKKIMLCGQ